MENITKRLQEIKAKKAHLSDHILELVQELEAARDEVLDLKIEESALRTEMKENV